MAAEVLELYKGEVPEYLEVPRRREKTLRRLFWFLFLLDMCVTLFVGKQQYEHVFFVFSFLYFFFWGGGFKPHEQPLLLPQSEADFEHGTKQLLGAGDLGMGIRLKKKTHRDHQKKQRSSPNWGWLICPQQGSARVPPGFHQGSTRVPPGFHQGSTRVPRGSTRFHEGCGVVRALKRATHAVGVIT